MKIRSFEECVTCFMGDFILLGFSYGLSTIEWLDRSQVSFFPLLFCLLRAKKKERSWESELPVLERVGVDGGK